MALCVACRGQGGWEVVKIFICKWQFVRYIIRKVPVPAPLWDCGEKSFQLLSCVIIYLLPPLPTQHKVPFLGVTRSGKQCFSDFVVDDILEFQLISDFYKTRKEVRIADYCIGSQSYIRGVVLKTSRYNKIYGMCTFSPLYYLKNHLKKVGTTPKSLKVHYFKYKPMSCSTYIILSCYKNQILLYLKVGHNSYGLKMLVDKQNSSDFPPLRDLQRSYELVQKSFSTCNPSVLSSKVENKF